jgi:4-alpha-glucanotransferase
MYQIFVDRFFDGSEDKALSKTKTDCIIHESWDEQPLYKPDPVSKEVLCNDFFGGNLKGIIQKLPYLKELGVDVLYLNPLFEAYSNHKYDVGDYMKIDPMFGDLDTLRHLCESAESIGIRILFDGVFSHTGSDSVYFNKKGKYPSIGAYQSKESPYYRWYRFMRHPEIYESWWGINTLPNVNEMDASYMDFIIDADDSVSKYWIKQGIKGWRLDVVDELPDEFLKKFRLAVKSADAEAVIIGEVWEDASRKMSYGKRREYLLGEELDSVMNYPLREMLFKFLLGEWDAWQINRGILSLYENYPSCVFYSLMNMIGTHDVARAKTILSGAPPDHILTKDEQSSYRMSAEMEELALKRLKLACLFQMTFPGVPCIYYGDEAGLSGYRDPFNRGTYPWGREDNNLVAWFKKVIALRKRLDALRTGEYIPIYADVDVYGYVRRIKDGEDVFGNKRNNGFAVVLINRSQYDAQTVSLDLESWGVNQLRCVFDDKVTFVPYNGRVEVDILPLSARVLEMT